MKYLLFVLLVIVCLIGCKKEIDPNPAPQAQTCDFVFDRHFENPPADTTLANRKYFLSLVKDTSVCINCYHPAGNLYNKEVSKITFDTIKLSSKYCY